MSKVSVAIPTYNRGEYLKEAIQSVLNQTFQDFSLFVFDNASTEPTEQVVNQFEKAQFIGSEKNLGAEGNLNRILEHPFDSEYVIIFHDDDTMHPRLIEEEVKFLDAHANASFVVTDLQRGNDETMQEFATIEKKDLQPKAYKGKEFMKAQMQWLRYGFPSAMYRVQKIGQTRMKPEFFHFFDMVFLAELAQKGEAGVIPAPLMIHRIHEGQYSSQRKDEYEQGALRLLALFREHVDKKTFQKYALNFLLRTCAHLNRGAMYTRKFLALRQKEGLFRWEDARYLDSRGLISIFSLGLGGKKIIDSARWLRNSLPS